MGAVERRRERRKGDESRGDRSRGKEMGEKRRWVMIINLSLKTYSLTERVRGSLHIKQSL